MRRAAESVSPRKRRTTSATRRLVIVGVIVVDVVALKSSLAMNSWSTGIFDMQKNV